MQSRSAGTPNRCLRHLQLQKKNGLRNYSSVHLSQNRTPSRQGKRTIRENVALFPVIKTKLEIFALRALRKYGRRALLMEKLDMSSRPVFVYQMGKVGSASIRDSLAAQYHQPVVHGHGFAPDFHNWQIPLLYHVFMEGKGLDIITLTREPISRNVSHFFQKFTEYSGHHFNEFSPDSPDKLLRLFLDSYDHDLATYWFEEHIQRNFGIDVYSRDIPNCGYQFYEKGRVRVLLIKLETDNAKKEDAIKKFFNLDSFTISNSNISKKKPYGTLYQSFVEKVRLPRDYIEARLSSRYFKHFYDEKTSNAVWDKWHKKVET